MKITKLIKNDTQQQNAAGLLVRTSLRAGDALTKDFEPINDAVKESPQAALAAAIAASNQR